VVIYNMILKEVERTSQEDKFTVTWIIINYRIIKWNNLVVLLKIKVTNPQNPEYYHYTNYISFMWKPKYISVGNQCIEL